MLNQITKMRLPNGVEVALVDWTDKPLFSTVDLLHGFVQQEINLFSYVVGDPVPGFGPAAATRRTSNEADTNISTPGAMASTEEMLVYSIRVETFGLEINVANDFTTAQVRSPGQPGLAWVQLKQLHRYLILRLVISQKVYAEAGLGYFVAGFGPAGQGVAETQLATGVTLATNGLPSQEAVRSFVIPHHIGGQEKYRVTLLNPAAAAAAFGMDMREPPVANANLVARLRIYLDGLYKRPVS